MATYEKFDHPPFPPSYAYEQGEGQEPDQKENGAMPPAAPQQQPGIVYVVTNDQVVLPATPNAPNGDASQNPKPTNESFLPHIILSCFVFWLFGVLFGLVAFILALVARRKQARGDSKAATDVGKMSYVTSLIGIVVAIVVVFVVVILFVVRDQKPPPPSARCRGQFALGDKCYTYRSTLYAKDRCQQLRGYYSLSDKSCYYNNSPAVSACRYFINLKCFPYVDSAYTVSTCANIGGFFTTIDTDGKSGSFCYYRQFNCTYHFQNNQCYRFKIIVDNETECKNHSGHYLHGYCYNDCPRHKYLINETCYENRVPLSPQDCTKHDGHYNAKEKLCYHGKSCVSGYMKNGTCYKFVDSSFTKSTCRNIGGYFADKGLDFDHLCYFVKFNCTFYDVNGQCYQLKSAVIDQQECGKRAGYYDSGFCYYDCPESKFLINSQCFDNRSTEYSQAGCAAVSGLYVQKYCYLKGCNYTVMNGKCYRYTSQEYSNDTCVNIGGYVATMNPSKQVCYYNSFNCRYHAVNGQCYTRLVSLSWSQCRGIPRSYHDASNSSCYYYCTEMPSLRRCIVASSRSYSNETCRLIGGTYSNGTCYFVSKHCPGHAASNGQCYGNRTSAFNCDTCRNIGGHFDHSVCLYHRYNCALFNINGQCYSNQSRLYQFSRYACTRRSGFYDAGRCYYEAANCGYPYRANCACYRYASSYRTADTCANIGGYYDFNQRRCLYNSSACLPPYFSRSSQCYKYRSTSFSRATCSLIGGVYAYYIRQYACYYNRINCSNWANDSCYIGFSATYNEATCYSIGGYYMPNKGCYYNGTECRYWRVGQCYDKRYSGWTSAQCNEANGYFIYSAYYPRCYLSNYYCPYVLSTVRKCFMHLSMSYDCSSCRLLDGSISFGRCYYNEDNCTEPLFHASNNQCYANSTRVRSTAECRSLSTKSFYDLDGGVCYYTAWVCPAGHEANCQCYAHKSAIYTPESCKNFGGHYTNGMCYYNTSHCPNRYFSVNGQCYRRYGLFSPSTCQNIDGYYRPPSTVGGSGTCFYNTFNCTGFIVDGRHCYMNRSASYSRATCRNIGGMYGYLSSYTGRAYRSAGSYIYPGRTYHCLYDTFNCVGYTVENECHKYQSSSMSQDTCRNINGSYVEANHTCYYHEYSCPYYNVGGQCHTSVLCNNASCDTCKYYGGYFDPRQKCCYYTSRACKFYLNGECYENSTTASNASDCATRLRGFFMSGRCYYRNRVAHNCSAEYYHWCTCYRKRSTTYNNDTCYNIGGYYTDNYCYYITFDCRGFVANQQCYRRRSRYLTRGSCGNIGGHYSITNDTDSTDPQPEKIPMWTFTTTPTPMTSTTTHPYWSGTTTPPSVSQTGVCFYNSFNCQGYAYDSQCYTNQSTAMNCPTCNNIGGVFGANETCYFYTSSCAGDLYSAGGQCHTSRSTSYSYSRCQRLDGYYGSGYCYYTASSCSYSQHYINCRCFSTFSSIYTAATCRNIRGTYAKGRCYYNSARCYYYWYRSQCYNRRYRTYSSVSCRVRHGGVHSGSYCYYNV